MQNRYLGLLYLHSVRALYLAVKLLLYGLKSFECTDPKIDTKSLKMTSQQTLFFFGKNFQKKKFKGTASFN